MVKLSKTREAVGWLKRGQFCEDVAYEDLDFGAEEDAVGVVAEPEGAGAEFVVGLEGVAFFSVHALDFDVEAQGLARTAGDGDFIGSEGFDIDEKGRSAWKDQCADFFAFREGLAADEEGGGEEVSDGGNFDWLPLAGLGIGGNPFAKAGEVAVVAFDACREGAGGVFFELGGVDRLEAIAGGSGIEGGVELVEGAGEACRAAGAGENGIFPLVGNRGAGFCGGYLSPAEAVFGLKGSDLGERPGGIRRECGLPGASDGDREEKNGEEGRHGNQGAEPNQPSG